MTERLLVDSEGDRVLVDDLSPHPLLDLIVEQDGLGASARLTRQEATAVRDALSGWLGEPVAALPRVEARVVPPHSWQLDPERSVAVELCVFRLCDWTSTDVRASTREQRDEAYREHLAREHAEELDRLRGLIP